MQDGQGALVISSLCSSELGWNQQRNQQKEGCPLRLNQAGFARKKEGSKERRKGCVSGDKGNNVCSFKMF